MPARGQRAGLGLAITHDASHDEVWVVERRAIGMGQRIAQLATFMNRSRHLGRHVARDALRPGELAKQPMQAVAVAFDGRIVLGVRAFQVAVRHDTRPAMARAHDVDHVQVVVLDEPVQVNVEQVQTRCRAPMAQQARLDVGERESPLQQRVVLQVDLPDRQVIRRTPVSVHLVQGVERHGIGHGDLRRSASFTQMPREIPPQDGVGRHAPDHARRRQTDLFAAELRTRPSGSGRRQRLAQRSAVTAREGDPCAPWPGCGSGPQPASRVRLRAESAAPRSRHGCHPASPRVNTRPTCRVCPRCPGCAWSVGRCGRRE